MIKNIITHFPALLPEAAFAGARVGGNE